MTSETRDFSYEHDGVGLIGQIAMPAGPGPHPAVLVMHSAIGMDEQVRRRARDLAALGYVALATDMYGAGRDGPSLDEYGGLFMALHERPADMRERIVATFDALRALPEVDGDRVGAIGFCFGGECVLELARSGVDLRAAVSFHGLLSTAAPAAPGTVKARLLVIGGERDPYAPPDSVAAFKQEMTDAGVDWQLTIYGEGWHAFTAPDIHTKGDIPGVRYDPLLDRLSWAQATAFLEAVLAPS